MLRHTHTPLIKRCFVVFPTGRLRCTCASLAGPSDGHGFDCLHAPRARWQWSDLPILHQSGNTSAVLDFANATAEVSRKKEAFTVFRLAICCISQFPPARFVPRANALCVSPNASGVPARADWVALVVICLR